MHLPGLKPLRSLKGLLGATLTKTMEKTMMDPIKNIPRPEAGIVTSSVTGETVYLRASNKDGSNPTNMASAFIGEHLFKNHNYIRKMYGEDLVRALEAGREAGYRQAQFDIRKAMGAGTW